VPITDNLDVNRRGFRAALAGATTRHWAEAAMRLCRDLDVFDDFAGSPSSATARPVATTALVRA
jgi:hypothetical protein